MTDRILCVDDDPMILKGIRRRLEEQFALDTAEGPQRGLEMLRSGEPYAVVVSDMRMPGMNGIEFLRAVRDSHPDTVRIMLTGYADLKTTMDAVNQGEVFRFLTKPCGEVELAASLTAGIGHYRLVMAERELVEGTLRGSIDVLSHVLSLVNPLAFGHANRVKSIVTFLARHLQLTEAWELEIAAMLSSLGCITVPEAALEKWLVGDPLSSKEQLLLDGHPAIGSELLASIPRLENVSQAIAYQHKGFDGSGLPHGPVRGTAIPLGGRLLRAALDFDLEETRTANAAAALARLRERSHYYDPQVLSGLGKYVEERGADSDIRLHVDDLRVGMVLAADVRTTTGQLLVAKGQTVSSSLQLRLQNFAQHGQFAGTVLVHLPASDTTDEPTSQRWEFPHESISDECLHPVGR